MGRRLGQHFLANKGIIKKIIETAEIAPNDVVLEIGPGRGALTFDLAGRAKKVIAVEKDEELAEKLRSELKQRNIDNIEIISGDIFKFLDSRFLPAPKLQQAGVIRDSYSKVVANIPYYLTSHLIRKLLESERKPENIILMIQKEVARRICATDGKENLLSLSVKFYADPKVLFSVSKGSFLPPPKVDSAVIAITPKKSPPPVLPERFFAVLKAGFSSPRKKLTGNLSKNLKISPAEIEKTFQKLKIEGLKRPGELSSQQWFSLTKCLET